MSDDETMTQKHRKERKDLQAKIQSLKKSASKGDKKKRKEILEEIAKLEMDLDKRQADELNQLNQNKKSELTIAEDLNTQDHQESEEIPSIISEGRISKAQRRRDRKAQEEKLKEAEISAQEELNRNGPRMLELQAIRKLLKERNLSIHPIASDGDCLYNAIQHQMNVSGRNCGDPSQDQVSFLRNLTANYILSNKESLIFYMTSPTTEHLMSDDEFQRYCETLRTTAAWGGQIEIRALSNVLKVPIEVIQATGTPTIQGADEFSGPNLVLTYHRHMYSLGEHYNSTKPFENDEENDGDLPIE